MELVFGIPPIVCLLVVLLAPYNTLAVGCSNTCGIPGSAFFLTRFSECDPVLLPASKVYNVAFLADTSALENNYNTNELADACDLGSPARDWSLRFVPGVSSIFTLNTDGSTFDTTLTIIECSTGRVVACNDDAVPLVSVSSFVEARLEKNVVYGIIVDGFGRSNQGPFTLRLKSIFWPDEEECPSIDSFAKFPSAVDTTMKLISGSSSSDSSRRIDTTLGCDLDDDPDLAVNSTTNLTRVDVVGTRIEASGTYTFLTCPSSETTVLPQLCKNASLVLPGEERRLCLPANATGEAVAPPAVQSQWFDAGEYVSFVAVNYVDRTKATGPYIVYGSINQTSPSPWCSQCRFNIAQTPTPTGRPTMPPFTMQESIHPLTNQTFLGDVYFIHADTPTSFSNLGVCGALNARVKVRDCAGNVLIEGRAGAYLTLEVTAQNVYALEVEALTARDRGEYTVQTTRAPACDAEVLGATFNNRPQMCYNEQVGVMVFVFLIFVLAAGMGTLAGCARGVEKKEFRQSASFAMVLLGSAGAVAAFSFLMACAANASAGVEEFLIFWISWSALACTVTFYLLSSRDWPTVFGEGLFFRADEDLVKTRLIISVFGLCLFFSLSISGFVVIGSIDGLASTFTFCAAENEICASLPYGAVIQKVFAVRTAGFGENGKVQIENFEQEFQYEFTTVDGADVNCSLPIGDELVLEETLCSNTCRLRNQTTMAANGVCEDDTETCSLGKDCTDCGPRALNTTRRLVRCNKSTSLVEFWRDSGVLGKSAVLPFLVAMIAMGAFFGFAAYLSSRPSSERAYSFSDSSLESEEPDAGEENPGPPRRNSQVLPAAAGDEDLQQIPLDGVRPTPLGPADDADEENQRVEVLLPTPAHRKSTLAQPAQDDDENQKVEVPPMSEYGRSIHEEIEYFPPAQTTRRASQLAAANQEEAASEPPARRASQAHKDAQQIAVCLHEDEATL